MRHHHPPHQSRATPPERMENYIGSLTMITCQVSWTSHDQPLHQLELSLADFICFMLNLNAVTTTLNQDLESTSDPGTQWIHLFGNNGDSGHWVLNWKFQLCHHGRTAPCK